MNNYERKILKNGKDIGLREDNRGAIYINRKIYLKNDKVKAIIRKLSESGITENKTEEKQSEEIPLVH